MTDRYERQKRVPGVGADGQEKLARARVLLIGAGGLGSPAALYLAGAGVGTLGLVDDDRVDLTNLHRQIVHTTASVGRPKTESAAQTLTALNPEITVELFDTRVDASNAVDLLCGWDLVLDGCDDFATRYLISDAATVLGIAHVWASVSGSGGQLSVFDSSQGPTYRDLFPALPAPGAVPSCAQAGVLPTVPGVLGVAMAAEALKLLLGVGQPLVGRVAIYDMLTAEWEQIPLRASADAQRPQTAAEVGAGLPPTLTTAQLERMLGGNTPAGSVAGAAGAFVLVDVRTEEEHKAGTIPHARHLPVEEIEADPASAARVLGEAGGAVGSAPSSAEQGERVFVFCASGARSARAAHALQDAGVDAVDVVGGFEAWLRRGGERWHG